MRKGLKKIVSGVMSLAMVVSTLTAFGPTTEVSAANQLSNLEWVHYHQAVETNDAAVSTTTVTEMTNGFKVNVGSTGWQRLWSAPADYSSATAIDSGYGDNPYQLYSKAYVPVAAGSTYSISFTVANGMSSDGTAREKNLTVSVLKRSSGDVISRDTIRVSANGSYNYSKSVTIPSSYSEKTVIFQIAYGCYAYSVAATNAGMTSSVSGNPYLMAAGTTEPISTSGTLTFSNMNFSGTAATAEAKTYASTTTDIPEGYSYSDLVWSDEFNEEYLDTNSWSYEIGNGSWGWGNGESEFYTSKEDNVYIADISNDSDGSIDNKALAIKAKRDSSVSGSDYTSGRIKTQSKVQYKYGYVEAKIKMDKGMASGIWPAFWLLGTSGDWPYCGEYDIMEHANANGYMTSTLHWYSEAASSNADSGANRYFDSGDLNDWHTYAMDWTADYIKFYLDGVLVYSQGYSSDAAELWANQAYVILNLAVGGQFINWSMPDSAWNDSTIYVDYVRIYQNSSKHTGSSFSGSWDKDDFWTTYGSSQKSGSGSTTVTPQNNLSGWTHVHSPLETNDAGIASTSCTDTDTGFGAKISITGWQRLWSAPSDYSSATAYDGGYGDRPTQLRSYTTASVTPGKTYNLGFDVSNKVFNSDGSATEKNITVVVNKGEDISEMENLSTNMLVFDTVRIPAGETLSYNKSFTVPSNWNSDKVTITICYGCYAYSYAANAAGVTSSSNPYLLAPGTTENINATGRITFYNAYCVTPGTKIVTEDVVPDGETVTWTHSHEPLEDNDAGIANTSIDETPSGFSAYIPFTGWQRLWTAPTDYPNAVAYDGGYGDNPYQLTSTAKVNVTAGETYTLSFDIDNNMYAASGDSSEKNITITINSGIDGDTDNNFVFETIRVPGKSVYQYTKDITIPEDYTGSTISIQLAYGCYAYSYAAQAAGATASVSSNPYLYAPGTTENINAVGKLSFNNVTFKKYEEIVLTPEIEITGYQISTSVGGFRTIYSMTDPNNEITERGLLYGLQSKVSADQMVAGSSNSYVKKYAATSTGLSTVNFSEISGATSYAMTMRNIKSTEFYNAGLYVRAYAKLADGSYIYSDVCSYSIYKVANLLYQGRYMSSKSAHDYLYNNILTVVDPSYSAVDYDWGDIITK